MSQSSYSQSVQESLETALDREADIIGRSDGPEDLPAIDLALFPSTEARPVAKLTTVGMSQTPLAHPDHDSVHVELAMSFPSAWRLDDEASHWPIHELLKWATYPLMEDIFVWRGQTLTSEPIQRLAPDVDFCGWLAAKPSFVPETAASFAIDDREIYLIDLIPLYREELTYADERSSDDLLERLREARTPQLVNPHRQNVCA